MDSCQFKIGWIGTKSGQVKIFRNNLPADIMEKDCGDDDLLISLLLF